MSWSRRTRCLKKVLSVLLEAKEAQREQKAAAAAEKKKAAAEERAAKKRKLADEKELAE